MEALLAKINELIPKVVLLLKENQRLQQRVAELEAQVKPKLVH